MSPDASYDSPDPSSYDTLIFASHTSGLANRLRALVGYEAVSRLRRWRFGLCWVPTLACDAEFTDLFEPPAFPLITREDARRLHSARGTLMCTGADWFHEIWKARAPDIPWMTFLREVRGAILRLKPAPAVGDAVAAFLAAHPLADALGVHIRHTDNVELFSQRPADGTFDPRQLSTIDGFLEIMRADVARGPVFLATDNMQIERSCRAEFGPALITYPKRYTLDWDGGAAASAPWRAEPRRTTAVEDALIEMRLLGACRRIVGTYYSSYSKFAAVWGRTEYQEIAGRVAAPHPVIEATLAELRSIEAEQARGRSSAGTGSA